MAEIIRNKCALLCFVGLAVFSALALGDLSTSYPHSATLYRDHASGDLFRLHWALDWEQSTASFAVNVSTSGWVGLGLSPMPGSDVIVGWVRDDGDVWFDVSDDIHYVSSTSAVNL